MELLSLKQYLLETKKVETRLHDELEEYAADPNIYFTFSNIKNSSSNRNIHDQHSPSGIWCYNLKSAWNHLQIGKLQSLKKVPYSFHENSITLFSAPFDIKLVSGKSYGEEDYNSDSKQLLETYKDKIVSAETSAEKLIKDSYSQYYNERIFLLTKYIANLFPDVSKKWTSIIKELGYQGFADSYGSGYISTKEKYISVIVDKSDLEYVTKVQI